MYNSGFQSWATSNVESWMLKVLISRKGERNYDDSNWGHRKKPSGALLVVVQSLAEGNNFKHSAQ